MLQSIGKKNKIIIYLLFLFILSTTSAKFINDQKKLSSSINILSSVKFSVDINSVQSLMMFSVLVFLNALNNTPISRNGVKPIKKRILRIPFKNPLKESHLLWFLMFSIDVKFILSLVTISRYPELSNWPCI